VQCPKCSYENPDDAKVCNLCGELFTTREPGGRGMVMRVGGYRTPKELEPNRKLRGLLWFLALLGLIAVALAWWFFVRGG